MKSIEGGIGGAKRAKRGAAPKGKVGAKKAPLAKPFRVLAVVKDRATGRPVSGAHYDLVKKGAEKKILAQGATAHQGIVDQQVDAAGTYLVRVKSVTGHKAPPGKPLAQGSVPGKPANVKPKPVPVLLAPQRGGAKKPNPKNKKPAKKPTELAMKHLQLEWHK